MIRLRDWRSRLDKYIKQSDDRPFQPGAFDCSLFAAGAVLAMTGVDPAVTYRGQYQTIEEGLALIRADGHLDHVALVGAHFDRIPVVQSRVGDVAVVEQDGSRGLGIVLGPSVAVVTLRGLGHVPLMSATRAYRV